MAKMRHARPRATRNRPLPRKDASCGCPTLTLTEAELAEGVKVTNALADSGLVKSRGEARRLLQQGGIRLWDERLTDVDRTFTPEDFREVEGVRAIILRAGKGKVLKLILS